MRWLEVEGQPDARFQAVLAVDSLPSSIDLADWRFELMFECPERLGFGADVVLNARYVDNVAALRMARRGVQDADQVCAAEEESEAGVTAASRQRSMAGRELVAALTNDEQACLFRASIALSVWATSRPVLEERIETCRRVFGGVRLVRSPAIQADLLKGTVPGRRGRVGRLEQVMTPEQVAALVPFGSHAVGSLSGSVIGAVIGGGSPAVRFDAGEGPRRDLAPSVICLGAPGRGKTTLAQKLCLDALNAGARVVDCDPKGDHRLHLLPQLDGRVEAVHLGPDQAFRGLLDPLRIAPVALRQEAAVTLLLSLLPTAGDLDRDAAVATAVDRVVARDVDPCLGNVIRALAERGGRASDLADVLDVYSRSGLTQLAFGEPAVNRGNRLANADLTYLSIRELPSPQIGTARSEYTHGERVGEQLVRLLALFASRLLGDERERLKVFSFDEGWRLLGDPVGRALLDSLQRTGRSERAVAIVSTQLTSDALSAPGTDDLFGAAFAFGVTSEPEARAALSLLGLDSSDDECARTLTQMRAGQCLFRDHDGRVEAVQITLDKGLAAQLSTTPA